MIKKFVNPDMCAKKEGMFLHQILEEHIKNNDKFKPCNTCIRLALNKGYRLGKKELLDELNFEEVSQKEIEEKLEELTQSISNSNNEKGVSNDNRDLS